MKKVYPRISELRNGLSLKEMQKKTGIPSTTIDRAERGDSDPKTELLLAYHRTFGVSVDWLLGLTDERMPHVGSFVTANGTGAVAAGRDAKTASECKRCAEKDATIARLSETVQSLSSAIAAMAGKK